MEVIIAFLIFAVVWLVVQLQYAWVFGDTFTSPKEKVCYVIEVKKDLASGVGLLSVPELEIFPDYYGNIVFKEKTTLAKAKLCAISLRLKNPRKHYKVCFHY